MASGDWRTSSASEFCTREGDVCDGLAGTHAGVVFGCRIGWEGHGLYQTKHESEFTITVLPIASAVL